MSYSTWLEQVQDVANVPPYRDEQSWIRSLQTYLNVFLSAVVPDSERSKFLTPDAMKVWAEAFTHASFSPDFNYEELEIIGDTILRPMFFMYLRRIFPNVTAPQMTNSAQFYISKPQQSKFANSWGFTKFVRAKGPFVEDTVAVPTDLMESFLGAFRYIADSIASEQASVPTGSVTGAGFAYTYNFVVFIYGSLKIDMEKYGDRPNIKTVFKELVERYSGEGQFSAELQRQIIKISTDARGVTTVISNRHLKGRRSVPLFEKIKDPELAKFTKPTQSQSEDAAYEAAVNLLEKSGYPYAKAVEKFSPEIEEKLKRATAKSPGYEKLYLGTISKSRKDEGISINIVQLIGTNKQTGVREVLATRSYTNRGELQEARRLLLDEYNAA